MPITLPSTPVGADPSGPNAGLPAGRAVPAGLATPGPAARAQLADRVGALEAVFRRIATQRMAGLPMLHPGLRVQAVGFAEAQAVPGLAVGVLVTPWFMNLLRLPLVPVLSVPAGRPQTGAEAPAPACLAVGQTASRRIGSSHFDFLGAFEEGLGAFEASSLFSPMTEFVDHAAAVATAFEVLKLVRGEACIEPLAAPRRAASAWAATASPSIPVPAAPVASPVPAPAPDLSAATAARRGFLLGRRPAAGGPR